MRWIGAIALIITLASAEARPAAADKPNIVFILADDLGYADLKCMGHPLARTPNLDRLAAEGTRFQRFYSTGVTCCPARTGLMTGKFPATYAKYPADYGFGERTTVTELLKKRGYTTGHFGKWHIGPTTSAGTYGIDVIGGDGDGKKAGERGRDAHLYDDALRFIEQNKDSSFYVNVWDHISHFPIRPPAALVEKFRDLALKEEDFAEPMRAKFAYVRKEGGDPAEAMRRYLADVASLDDEVGRLLRKLDDLGLREKTIVVFSSDQGPGGVDAAASDPADDRDRAKARFDMMGYVGEFRGGKHGLYEGGVRVPFLVRWPGRVPAGRVNETSVLSGADWLPTIAAVTEAPADAAALDGESMLDVWTGAERTRTRPLYWKTSTERSPTAVRDGAWKLIHPNRKKGEVELYDVSADPGERRNVAAEHPDVVQRLGALAQRWTDALPDHYDKRSGADDR